MKRFNFEGFDQAHELWLNEHLLARKGERKDRLKRGHAHGEILFLKEIWWPLFGSFEDLHPEYEILDWRGAPCYLDFAWLPGTRRFNIDVKGYGPHVQQTDRTRYSRELLREIYLQTLGYRNISIPYDSLQKDPALIRQLLKGLLGPYTMRNKHENNKRSFNETIIIHYLKSSSGRVSPTMMARDLGFNKKTAAKYLRLLAEKGIVRPIKNNVRVTRYEYIRDINEAF